MIYQDKNTQNLHSFIIYNTGNVNIILTTELKSGHFFLLCFIYKKCMTDLPLNSPNPLIPEMFFHISSFHLVFLGLVFFKSFLF